MDDNYDLVMNYIHKVYQIPLLTEEEEHGLLRKVILRDEEAARCLIESNLRYAVDESREFTDCGEDVGIPLADLIQHGNKGLREAVDHIKESTEHFYADYASEWVRLNIIRAITEQLSYVQFPVNLLDAMEYLLKKLGRKPTDEELAERIGSTYSGKDIMAACSLENIRDLVEKNIQMSFFDSMNNGYQKAFFEELNDKKERRRKQAEKTEIDLIVEYIRFEQARLNRAKGYISVCGTGVRDRVVLYKSVLRKELTQGEIHFTTAVLGITSDAGYVPVHEAMNIYGISQRRYEELCRIFTRVAEGTRGLWKRCSLSDYLKG